MNDIPMHMLLDEDLANLIYEEIEGVASTNSSIDNASRKIQQAIVDHIQLRLEDAARGGYPFRLVERSA
jgi:hypothetical protein